MPPDAKKTFTSFALALKHVIGRSEDPEFLETMMKGKQRQDEIETDLWEERERIKRSFDSKRKMNQLLQSLGSQYENEEVRLLGFVD